MLRFCFFFPLFIFNCLIEFYYSPSSRMCCKWNDKIINLRPVQCYPWIFLPLLKNALFRVLLYARPPCILLQCATPIHAHIHGTLDLLSHCQCCSTQKSRTVFFAAAYRDRRFGVDLGKFVRLVCVCGGVVSHKSPAGGAADVRWIICEDMWFLLFFFSVLIKRRFVHLWPVPFLLFTFIWCKNFSSFPTWWTEKMGCVLIYNFISANQTYLN